MYFTQDDYKRIEAWLYQRTVRDTDFPSAYPFNGTEKIPILQDSRHRLVGFNDFLKAVIANTPTDFYNVCAAFNKESLTLEEAITLIPSKKKRLGLCITFKSVQGNWLIYQFKGTSLTQWDSVFYWENIIEEALFYMSMRDANISLCQMKRAMRDRSLTSLKISMAR